MVFPLLLLSGQEIKRNTNERGRTAKSITLKITAGTLNKDIVGVYILRK